MAPTLHPEGIAYARTLTQRLTLTGYLASLWCVTLLGLDWLLEANDELPELTRRWLKGVATFVSIVICGVIVYTFRYVRLTATGAKFWPVGPWGLWGSRWIMWDRVVSWSIIQMVNNDRPERFLQVLLSHRAKPLHISEHDDWFDCLQGELMRRMKQPRSRNPLFEAEKGA